MSGSRNRYSRRTSYQHRPHQLQPHTRQHHSQEHRDSIKLSRINSFLSRIRDESDSGYTRKTSNVNQLVALLGEPYTPWEKTQIFEAITQGSDISPGLDAIFEDLRAPHTFKLAIAKCLAQMAIIMNTEINLYFRWVFERLRASGISSKEKEKERKIWLLTSLREIFSRNQTNSISQNIQQHIPGLLHDLEGLLDSMDSSDYFPGIIDVLDRIAEKYSVEFGERFQDIIDLLVGCHFLADMEALSGVTISDNHNNEQNNDHNEGRTQVEKIKSNSNNDEEEEKEKSIPVNLKSLLSCFQAVAAAVGQFISKEEDMNNTNNKHPFDNLRIQATKFWMFQVKHGFQKELTITTFDDWFDFFLQILAQWIPNIHPDVINILLNPNSPLMKLRWIYPLNSRLHSDVMDMIYILLNNYSSTKNLSPSSNNQEKIKTLIHQITIEIKIFWILCLLIDKMGKYDYFDTIIMGTMMSTLRQKNDLISFTFHSMISLILELLKNSNDLSLNSLSLIIEWLQDILDFCKDNQQFYSKEFNKMIQKEIGQVIDVLFDISRTTKIGNIRAQIPKIIRHYFDIFGTLCINKNMISQIMFRINDIDSKVKSEFSNLIFGLNPFLFSFRLNLSIDQLIKKFKKDLVITPHSGSFRPPHFQIVMNHLGMNDFLSIQDASDNTSYCNNEKEWKSRLFYSCGSVDIFERMNQVGEMNNQNLTYSNSDISDIATIISNSNDLLTFWTVWEVSRYCMLSRLRTPFGGPKQTFDAFEKRLVDLLEENFPISIEPEGIKYAIKNSVTNMRQLREILNIFDRLELQIYNATIGTALGSIPQSPRASIMFFRTNRKVCDDWFSRIRKNIVKGAIIVGDNAMAIRHERVNELKQGSVKNKLVWLSDFEQILVDVVSCLQKLNSSDSISGLLAWSKNIYSLIIESKEISQSEQIESEETSDLSSILLSEKYFSWMTCSRYFAESKYELAAKEGIDSLNFFLKDDNNEILKSSPQLQFLSSQIIDSYCKMNDWSSLAKWLSSYNATEFIVDPLVHMNLEYFNSIENYNENRYLEAWELIDGIPLKLNQNNFYHRGIEIISSLNFLHTIVNIITIKSDISNLPKFLTEFVNYIYSINSLENQQISFTNSFVNDLTILNTLNSSSLALKNAFNILNNHWNQQQKEMSAEVIFEYSKLLYSRGSYQEAILRENLIEKCLSLAITVEEDDYPSCAKAWFANASYHYRRGRQILDEMIHNKLIEESDKITATLRILRLLVKYGSDLESSFNIGFNNNNMDVRSWENIIPQLFSRLDHPDYFVQQQLCKLLCKIATNSPQLVVYNTLVALNSHGTSEQSKQLLKRIADSLDNSNGALIAEIRHVIEELKHLTVLWEELWFNKLNGLQLDINKRFLKIEKEFERINDNLNLSSDQRIKFMKESYDTIVKPVISSIERLYNNTILITSTPHEKWFLNKFGNRIHESLELLRSPRSIEGYKDGWDLLRNIQKELSKVLQTNRSIKLSDISPFLNSINSSQITMPGLNGLNTSVTIQSFDEIVIILPTKTKPKKLFLRGSDGKQYGYLFKGLEDLHLDERIMQLLQITNNLLLRDKDSCKRNLRSRNYAVIPLGDHSGMIQWVENAAQMFTLYKKWQLHEHFANIPSDMFFEKIAKNLKKEGWNSTTSRRNWPHIVLKSVFLELLSETPSNLLEKEIWASCTTPIEWITKSTSLSRSLAVMSVIGYIIGLGDRHLDNILIDFEYGEVIHIDYNVCFEKGKKLKVPETVPFRLTQNIVTALGVTGVEGVFRIASEIVLGVLRKNKEILITLLEAFVYDPLIDWHVDLSEDRNKQFMELEENFGLLTSRIAELRMPIENNREHLSKLLSKFEQVWKQYVNIMNLQTETREYNNRESGNRGEYGNREYNNLEFNIREYNNLEFNTREYGEFGGEYSNREFNIEKNIEIENYKSALSQRANECALWNAQHEKTIQSIQGPLLQVIFNEVFSSSPQIGLSSSIFNPYLQILSKNEFILQQCSKIEQDFMGWMNERNSTFKNCLERLQFYRALIIPVTQVLLSQDYYVKWPPILYSLLNSSLTSHDFQNHLFSQISGIIFNDSSAHGISLFINEFDELFNELKNSIYKIQILFKESNLLLQENQYSISEFLMDDFTVYKLDVITNILIACEKYSKENQQSHQSNNNTIWISSISLADSFKTSSPDSFQKLWRIIDWSVFEFFIPNVKLLYNLVINRIDTLIKTDLNVKDIGNHEDIIDKIIEKSIFSTEEIQIQKHKVKQYCFHGSKMKYSLIRQQFMQNLTQDVNRFAILENLLQELSVRYRTIDSEIAEFMTIHLISENSNEILHSFGEAVANQQIIFAQEFERIKHVVSLCNSILHLETFRTTDKTFVMDADTLHLVKRLQSAVIGRNPLQDLQLDITQQLSNLTVDDSGLPRNLENLTKDLKNKIDEIKSLVIDLIPLIESIANTEIDTEDINGGKDIKSKAKEFMREWSNLDFAIDNGLNNTISVVGGHLKYNNETSDSVWNPDSISILENTRQETVSRNAFAVGIIRQIKAKLEGKDFDSNVKMTAQEQIDKIIEQATNIDNLCVMYEGWTPWI
ncbi:6070_t:CDS:10 [Diversispora eburnea]|uniref:non-specific serine/threonine protein kinase n=1 Tax=Diversispora eburnea TaxID=1213867 RepID=A0A9N8V016_9GLOM|nr:6070_t:CDS:10 [Diversispora eburnea]